MYWIRYVDAMMMGLISTGTTAGYRVGDVGALCAAGWTYALNYFHCMMMIKAYYVL